jgi:DNA repair photolyase
VLKNDIWSHLHKEYRDNCFLVRSITTCDEKIRRIIEPGTPPSSTIFNVIRKFIDEGVRCVVNIDPILPLITDSYIMVKSVSLHRPVLQLFELS